MPDSTKKEYTYWFSQKMWERQQQTARLRFPVVTYGSSGRTYSKPYRAPSLTVMLEDADEGKRERQFTMKREGRHTPDAHGLAWDDVEFRGYGEE